VSVHYCSLARSILLMMIWGFGTAESCRQGIIFGTSGNFPRTSIYGLSNIDRHADSACYSIEDVGGERSGLGRMLM